MRPRNRSNALRLGVISALIVIVGVLVGFFIGAIIDGDVAFRIGKGDRVR